MSGWDPETRRFTVAGRVQGVGYRAYVARVARALGLTGGASNLMDGRVSVIATGPGHALDRFESALREGPRHSRVDTLETAAGDAKDARADQHDVEF